MASNEETNAAGTDTRPPMLVENDYESWKIRIHRYIRGKPNGKLIWKSIQDGPTPHPMVTDPPPANSTVMPAPRKKLDSEFNDEENKLEMADTQAEIILSQGLPRHIFNILKSGFAKGVVDPTLFTRKAGKHILLFYIISMPCASCQKSPQETGAVYKSVDPLPMLLNTTSAPEFANLLCGLPKQFTPTIKPSYGLPPNSRITCYGADGHIVTETNAEEAPEKGVVLAAEAEAFLLLWNATDLMIKLGH
ncbi:hypothetical protein Tco_0524890 [Tanacetum coccineum]